MKHKFLLIALSILLASCTTVDFSKLSKKEIKNLSYEDLCNPYAIKNDLATAEMKRRGVVCDIMIDNCKLTHKLNPKSPAFAQCVNNYRQAEQVRQQMALNQIQQNYYQNEQLRIMREQSLRSNGSTTNCRPNYIGGFTCNTF